MVKMIQMLAKPRLGNLCSQMGKLRTQKRSFTVCCSPVWPHGVTVGGGEGLYDFSAYHVVSRKPREGAELSLLLQAAFCYSPTVWQPQE